MQSTMMDVPLTVAALMRYGTSAYADREVVTCTSGGTRRQSYGVTGARAARLANALRSLGVDADQRVATLMWNNAEHLEAYLAIPSMGAVLHTLNLRLDPEVIGYIATHAGDDVVIVDPTLVPLLAQVLPHAPTIRHIIVTRSEDGSDVLSDSGLARHGRLVHSYEDLLAAQPDSFGWPDLDERSAAAMCYTSGTTGRPKGVVYSHRSAYLHSMGVCTGNVFGLSEQDRVLPVVPMFHANAWGLPYAALMAGADLIMPDRYLQPEPLVRLIEAERPTLAGAVPTIWNMMLAHVREHGGDLSSLRLVPCGGSAVPHALQVAYEKEKLGGRGHGLFFHFVLEGLRGKARNSEGEISWASLADYATTQVARQAGKLVGDDEVKQTPQLLANIVGESPVLMPKTSLAGEREYQAGLKHFHALVEKRQAVEKWEKASLLGHPLAKSSLR